MPKPVSDWKSNLFIGILLVAFFGGTALVDTFWPCFCCEEVE